MMRHAKLASLCLLFWAGSFILRSSADEPSRPAAFTVTNAATRKLGSVELAKLLAEAIQAERIKGAGEVELSLARPWQAIDVPNQPLTLRILEMPTAALSSQFIIRFELRGDSGLLGIWQTAVQLKIWREIWVAGSSLRRGDPLDKADISLRRQDVLPLRDSITELPAPLYAYEMADFVPAGGALGARSLKLKAVVRRGQRVEAIAQNGALTVSVRVEALEEGAPGQLIRVRNPQSRRELRGKVQDENTVIVPL